MKTLLEKNNRKRNPQFSSDKDLNNEVLFQFNQV